MGNGRCRGNFWAIQINFLNLPPKIRHLGNIFLNFFANCLNFLASLENYSELFPCCLIFLRRNEKKFNLFNMFGIIKQYKIPQLHNFFQASWNFFVRNFPKCPIFFGAAWEKNPKFPQAAQTVWIVWKTLLLDSSDIFSGNQKSVGQQCCWLATQVMGIAWENVKSFAT